ncbi:hypothetical protein HMPREF1624_03114 [Sporothrix schenckii ATCC 58251]|uniref:Pentatricopeptide repeat domain-containing protein n=1 Tax=Sporothrix schenckii (strain ATCC 58251 / de Perez 2211183) TaxID=1391915 RepID=U7PZ32_SPOS1|nr:hypothetical protein HMPREF1624_03114 [Sporothrix schenckii ATCC 58251]
MRESRAICMLCRARQSVQAAARQEALSSQPRRRWHTTTATAHPRIPLVDGVAVHDGSRTEYRSADISRRPGGSAATAARLTSRSRITKQPPANDAALAVFRDIIENQQQSEHEQTRREQEGLAVTVADAVQDGGDLDKLAQELSKAHVDEFQEQQQQQQKQQHQEQPSAGRPATASVDLYKHLVKLTQLRSQTDATTATLFHHFETNMYPHMTETSRRLPALFRYTAHQLVREVSTAKMADPYAENLPSLARITQIRRQLDLLNKPEAWVPLVLTVATEIVHPGGGSSSSSSSSGGEASNGVDSSGGSNVGDPSSAVEKRTALLADLVEAWRMFNLPDIVVTDEEALQNMPVTEFRMASPDPARAEKYARRRNIQLGLSLLFPRYAPEQLRELAPAVLATYAILTDPAICTPEIKDRAHEFVDAIEKVVTTTNLKRRIIPAMYTEHPALGAYVLSRPIVGSPAETNKARAQNALSRVATSSKDARRATLDSIYQQLDQALRVRNTAACEAAWDRFWSAVSVPDVEGHARMRGSSDLLDYFIMVFTTLRMSDRAIAVWNLMAMAGIKPTLRTWTSFIEGFKRANNPAGIHNIWDRLVASGIQVDTAVWTARISGLIQSGAAEAGMQALDEMQRLWDASREEHVPGSGAKTDGRPPKAVKPTIEPVNAAIAGMLRRGDLAAAKKVLAWAGRHGIEPDVITFNTILRPLVREGAADEVAGLLEMMRQRGIRPDEATITILLDDTIGGGAMAGRSPRERAELVKQVLADVEAAGLDANQQNYAKIIYLLLQGGEKGRHSTGGDAINDQADAAVSVVFQRMRQRGIPMSSHIYTILAENYFMRTPPDLDAVRYLVEHGQPGGPARYETGQTSPSESPSESPSGSPSGSKPDPLDTARPPPTFDRVFWERIVRGFSQVGDTASALKYFAHIADSVSVTSSTLEDLLRALVHNNEWEAASQLVAKVQAQKMVRVQSGIGGETTRLVDARQFRHRFWHLAAEHGLLKD